LLTYVLNADSVSLMPCHPARARELVRKGRAYWVRRDTIRLAVYREGAATQEVTVGIDSGAENIGLAAVAKRGSKSPRVLFRMVVAARPVEEIKSLLDARRSYRRGRRSRQWYREPMFSPTRRVKFSVRVFDKDGIEIGKIPISQAKALCKPAADGRPQAVKSDGNIIRLLTRRKIKELAPEPRPGKNDVLVYGVDGRLITWFDPKRKDYEGLEKRLLGNPIVEGQRSRNRHKNPHKKPLARLEATDGRRVIRLLSRSAEKAVPKGVIPNRVPPFRTLGHKRKPKGWLSPSALALKEAHLRGLGELRKYVPVTTVRFEVCAFDTQKLDDPEIRGADYQRPELYAAQNRKDFVLARDGWKCVYCGVRGLGRGGVPLTVDHVHARHPRDAAGGSDHIGNLVAACSGCQERKGNGSLEEFLARWKTTEEAARIRRYIAGLPKRNESFRSAARVGQIKTVLVKHLNAKVTWGYITKRDRLDRTRLPKSHDCDAITIASWGDPVDSSMPECRRYCVRRYPASKSSRRQRYKANPLGHAVRVKPAYAARLVGFGPRLRWVQPIGVNRYADTPAGQVRLRDVVKTTDGRVGYVMKINSNGHLTISLEPSGKARQKTVSARIVTRILWRRRGLMENLGIEGDKVKTAWGIDSGSREANT